MKDDNQELQEFQLSGQDWIAELKKTEAMAILQRNLAIVLAQKSALDEALPLCLELALLASEMDCGGIYLVDSLSRDLVLKEYTGLSQQFVNESSDVKNGSDRHKLVMIGLPLYMDYPKAPVGKNEITIDEGLRAIAIVPIQFNGEVIACMNIASHSKEEIPNSNRRVLEDLSIQIGSVIGRFQIQNELNESRHQLQSMFDSLMDFVFVLTEDGGIIQINRMVIERLGYTHEELLGKSVLEVHPPELRKIASDIISEMLSGKLDTCLLDLIKKDGTPIPVETKVARSRWGNRSVLIGISRDISDRQKTDSLLREKIDEIEGFFTVSLDLLCIADFQGKFLRVNKAWETVLGYGTDELLHNKILDFIHPDDYQATSIEMSKIAAGLPSLNFVNRFRTKEGGWRFLEWRSQAQGKLVYAAARDITERKTDEDMRIQQNEMLAYRNEFEEILTSMSTRLINLPSSEIYSQINLALKQVGEFEHVDRSYVFILNEEKQELNNTHEWCAEGIDPQIDTLQNLPTEMLPWWMEKLKNLEEVYIPLVSQMPPEAQTEREILEAQSIQSVLVVPMLINNKLIGFLGFDSVAKQRFWSLDSILLIKMAGDIISNALMRIQMETNLLQSEVRNSALLSAIPDLIFRVRSDGIILDYKATSDELLALPKEIIIGSSISQFFSSDLFIEAKNKIEQALASGQVQTMEYNLKLGDSSHVFESRFKSSGADEVIAIVRDISDRARLEQMKSDFINRATHELRTPIATMLLMVSLIDSKPTNEEQEGYWDVLKSELNRERLLVEDLLSAGRLESNQTQYHFRSLDVKVLIEKVVDTFLMTAREKNIFLSIRAMNADNENHFMVDGDEAALTQVFVNLVNNAIKFTSYGGKVAIIIEKRDADIEISITDDGMGIPSEDLPLLFSRFFRGTNAIENEVQGTGIGLFIVRSILEKHNGKIQVTSELGKGSRFEVRLPDTAQINKDETDNS